MAYLKANHFRVDGSSSYPYEGANRTCRFTNTGGVQFSGLDAWAIKTDIVWNMQYFLANIGPLYVHMYVGGKKSSKSLLSASSSSEIERTFLSYVSGVFYSSLCTYWQGQTNHAMAIVGYGMDSASGQPYWKVRNSWGNTWEENGYVRVFL
ncbi:unnamed protein product [Didymodactylos carnosus]|uniref:Peptidase C1A papain C-terminal domain-containing protein n=1 Tax=Didymodactylos carnosus TaxID=1234261 RepID=A0A816DTE4_9BILA|nr:unnamed protein product [Didymodactylos carnosus]CAF4550756.1 unnamed protein product [Didymodactylos carnosus]